MQPSTSVADPGGDGGAGVLKSDGPLILHMYTSKDQSSSVCQFKHETTARSMKTAIHWISGSAPEPPPPPSLLSTGILEIVAADQVDSGVYICTANGVFATFTLTIEDTPSDGTYISHHMH